MSVTELSILQQGTRVRVVRGRYPLPPGLEGRGGAVVHASPYRPHRYGIQLDGEPDIRYVAREELREEPAPMALPEDRQTAKRRRALP